MNATQHKILSFLWNRGTASAKEIGKGLRIDPSTVSRNLRSLIREGFVISTGELEMGPYSGRKAKIYGLNPEKYQVIGFGLEQSEVAVAILNLRGTIIEKHH